MPRTIASIAHIYRNDIYLVLELLLLTFFIFLCSYQNSDGFLSPDSTNYLALAHSLVAGDGFYVSGYGYTGNVKDYFAIWPTGYPFLIATLAKLSGINVFWSSKVLNALLATFSLLLLRNAFGKLAYIYGLLFFCGASLAIFTYTWSESLFVFALIGFSIMTARVIENRQSAPLDIIALSLFALTLFSARYVGAFSIIIIGVLGLTFWLKGNYKKGSSLLSAAIICSIFVALHLKINHELSGYLTGRPRIPAPESNTELSFQLIHALVSELIFPIPVLIPRIEILPAIILQALALYWAFRKNHYWENPFRKDIKIIVFASIGIFYLITIISMRWITHFDNISFRFIFPGMLLVFIAAIRHIEINSPSLFQRLSVSLLALAAMSIILAALFLTLTKDQPTYNETISSIQKAHSKVPHGSIVVFGNMHLKYLRPDILLWSPWGLPYNSTTETWGHFLKRTGDRKIYLSKPDALIRQTYDESVNILITKHEKSGLIEIK